MIYVIWYIKYISVPKCSIYGKATRKAKNDICSWCLVINCIIYGV